MSETENGRISGEHIVRLQVEGVNGVVNTIEDQKTGRGLSLVCPFPALEVSIPVRLMGRDGESAGGCIHRIGVEDDPETGLPKLRLSVRSAADERDTVVKTPPIDLVKEASGVTAVSDDVLELELAQDEPVGLVPSTQSSELLQGLLGDLVDRNTAELLALEEIDSLRPVKGKEDPAWASAGPLFIPSDGVERSRTRRRRTMGAVAAWSLVMGIAAGGTFVLARAGVINVDSMTDWASGNDRVAANVSASVDTLATLNDEVDKTAQPALSADLPAPEATVAAPVAETADVPVEAAMPVETEMPVEAVAVAGAESSAPSTVETIDGTEIVLPTRWPAEYSTSYRLQDPNGVVVDVPGGLVRREGWLTLSEDEKIIRAAKAIQRENGARFIVYVNGDIPNFKTRPLTDGVRLSLYYDYQANPSATQQIAMLDR
jgi:hypothetical protein